MSTHDAATGNHRGLAWYITELIGRLSAGDQSAHERLLAVVGSRRARIGLEQDVVEIWIDDDGALVVEALAGGLNDEPDHSVDGEGHTRHHVVLDLLAGYLEITDAILDGDIEARGSVDSVAAMFAAIDILIDCATRIPALRELAEQYSAEHSVLREPRSAGRRRTQFWPPIVVDSLEEDLLHELGLRT
jgi:hypothetical protein